MKNARIHVLIWLMGFGLFACSTVKVVNTEPADDFNLSDYQTFNFYEVEASGDTLSQDFTERVEIIKSEIAKQLEQRGLTRSTTNPDLLINLGVVVNEKVQTRRTNIVTDPPTYIGQRRYTWRSQDVVVGRYRQGTVSIHFVDPKENKLVWRGIAEGVIPDRTSRLQKQAAEGVEELFSRLPDDQ